MGLCKYCGKYTDIDEWPEEFREASRPNLCFHCYEENPDRADYGHVEEPEEEPEHHDADYDTTSELDVPTDDEMEEPDRTDGEDEDMDETE